MAQTKAQLENLVVKYRTENEALHVQLEAHGTPHNVCDDITDFFGTCGEYVDTCTSYVKAQYSSLVS